MSIPLAKRCFLAAVHTGIAPERSSRERQEAGTRRQSNIANLYDGKLMRDAKKVSDTPCGGQIVMSGAVLQSISIEELRQVGMAPIHILQSSNYLAIQKAFICLSLDDTCKGFLLVDRPRQPPPSSAAHESA